MAGKYLTSVMPSETVVQTWNADAFRVEYRTTDGGAYFVVLQRYGSEDEPHLWGERMRLSVDEARTLEGLFEDAHKWRVFG